MSLNIKNERVHELAREAARRTGKSQTSVIEEALTRLLDDITREESADERLANLLAIAEDMQKRLAASGQGPLTTDDLYDERGLPA